MGSIGWVMGGVGFGVVEMMRTNGAAARWAAVALIFALLLGLNRDWSGEAPRFLDCRKVVFDVVFGLALVSPVLMVKVDRRKRHT